MRSTCSIVLAIICSLSIVLAENLPLESRNQGELVKNINGKRREYAKKYKVSDMHAMTWSDDLVELINIFGWQDIKEKSRASRTWRYVEVDDITSPVKDTEFGSFFGKNFEEQSKELDEREKGDSTLKGFEFLHPYQQFIGCVKKETGSGVNCALGLTGHFRIFNSNAESKGIASECWTGYKDVDGLCTSIEPALLSEVRRPDFVVNEINVVRRFFSMKFNIPNMHELTWSKDLVEMVKPLKSTDKVWPDQFNKWRHGYIPSYRNIRQDIADGIKDVISMNNTERDAYIATNQKEYAYRKEFVNTLQKTIGCETKLQKKFAEFEGLCLFGPSVAFDLWDLHNAPYERASLCDPGYGEFNGLCSIRGYVSPEQMSEQEIARAQDLEYLKVEEDDDYKPYMSSNVSDGEGMIDQVINTIFYIIFPVILMLIVLYSCVQEF